METRKFRENISICSTLVAVTEYVFYCEMNASDECAKSDTCFPPFPPPANIHPSAKVCEGTKACAEMGSENPCWRNY